MDRIKRILFVVEPSRGEDSGLSIAVSLAQSHQATLTLAAPAKPHEPLDVPAGNGQSIPQTREEAQALLDRLVATLPEDLSVKTLVLPDSFFVHIIDAVHAHDYDFLIKSAGDAPLLGRLFPSDDMRLMRKCPCPVWLQKPKSRDIKRILVGVDAGRHYPEAELPTRIELSRRCLSMGASIALEYQAELHVAYIWNPLGESCLRANLEQSPSSDDQRYIEQEARERRRELQQDLDAAMQAFSNAGLSWPPPHLHLPRGAARDRITELSDSLPADLVVLGTLNRTGIKGFLVGNTAEYLMHRLDTSVLALKPRGYISPLAPG